MYVYRKTDPMLWTVGFYDPKGKWYPEKDCESEDKAANRVAWLNGGKLAVEQNNAGIIDD